MEATLQVPETTSANALMFNRGSDARIAGKSLTDGPNDRSWKMGWRHAGRNWGKDARWPVAPLPPA